MSFELTARRRLHHLVVVGLLSGRVGHPLPGDCAGGIDHEDCPACHTRHKPAKVIVDDAIVGYHLPVEVAQEREGEVQPGRRLALRVPPEVAATLAGPAAQALADLEAKLALPVAIEPDATLAREAFDIGRL